MPFAGTFPRSGEPARMAPFAFRVAWAPVHTSHLGVSTMRIVVHVTIAAAVATLLAGCMSEVVRHATPLSTVAVPLNLVTTQAVTVELDSGFNRTIQPGLELLHVGTVPEGDVLKPVNRTFTTEGAHMHEAYLVMRGDTLVGFYLPVEASFSPLSKRIAIPTQKRSP